MVEEQLGMAKGWLLKSPCKVSKQLMASHCLGTWTHSFTILDGCTVKAFAKKLADSMMRLCQAIFMYTLRAKPITVLQVFLTINSSKKLVGFLAVEEIETAFPIVVPERQVRSSGLKLQQPLSQRGCLQLLPIGGLAFVPYFPSKTLALLLIVEEYACTASFQAREPRLWNM